MKRWFFIIAVSIGIISVSVAWTIALSKAFSSIAENDASAIVAGAGLNIIAIAIAVWAGLNIANAFDRRELLEYTSNLKNTNDSVKKELESTKLTLHERYIEEFLLALSSSLEPQHMRISRWLSVILHHNDTLVTTDGLVQLTKYETVYNRIVLLNKQKTSADVIISEVESVSDSIKEAIKKYDQKSSISAYLHFLLAELSYYSGVAYTNKSKYVKSVQEYQNAAEEYQQYVLQKFHFDITLHTDWGDNHSQKDNEEMAYLLNSIGSCYSECIRCFISSNNQERSDIEQLNWNEKVFFMKAEKCCHLSTAIQERTAFNREVYYRNYGCVFEREFMYHISLNHSANLSLLEKAGLQFEKAYSVDRTSSAVYHTVISNFDKRIREKIGIPIRINPKKIPKFKLLKKRIDNNCKEILKLLELQRPYLEAATRVFPADFRFVYFHIQSCTYYSLIADSDNLRKRFMNRAEYSLPYLELLAPNGSNNVFYILAKNALAQTKNYIEIYKQAGKKWISYTISSL